MTRRTSTLVLLLGCAGLAWAQPSVPAAPSGGTPVLLDGRAAPGRGGAADAGAADAGALGAGTVAGVPGARAGKFVTDAALEALWERWREASRGIDPQAQRAARAELLRTRQSLGLSDAELWSAGLLRGARRAELAGDHGAAVELARDAVALSPELPSAWTGLARAYFRRSPLEVGRVLDALARGVAAQWRDPRYLRPWMADWGGTLLIAVILLPGAVLLALALRKLRYFFYDFHHVFPRAARRWQSGLAGLLLLVLPLAFHLGYVPALLALFAALSLYLRRSERLVVACLVGLLGFVPVVGQALASATAFAGTPAERADAVDRAGPGAEGPARQLAASADAGKARFGELLALGRFNVLRGQPTLGAEYLKLAMAERPNDPVLKLNLGTALFLSGDLENPKVLFESAAAADPSWALPWYNLALLSLRRIDELGESVAGEADLVTVAVGEARRRDPSIVDPREATVDAASRVDVSAGPGGRALPSPLTQPLRRQELLTLVESASAARQVRSELVAVLTGSVPDWLGVAYPAVLALLVALLGELAGAAGAARPCQKCGRGMSRRGEPDEVPHGDLCAQCVHAFVSKHELSPALKVRKQLEVARYQAMVERTAYALSVLCTGLGHVFAGWPLRGVLLALPFLWAAAGFVMRDGVLRPPFDPFPVPFRLAPYALAAALSFFLGLRGLRKKLGAG